MGKENSRILFNETIKNFLIFLRLSIMGIKVYLKIRGYLRTKTWEDENKKFWEFVVFEFAAQ